MKRKVSIIFLIFVIGVFLTSCSDLQDTTVKISETAENVAVQGATEDSKLSAGENGILRIKDGHLSFFDYDTKKDYVLCSKANCSHVTLKCSGTYDGSRGATGLAEHGGKIYCLLRNTDENTYDMVQMDLDGGNRKTIAAINQGDAAAGKWLASLDSSDVYYCQGMALTVIQCQYQAEDRDEEDIYTGQCIAVDLHRGDVIEVSQRQKEEVNCFIDSVGEDGAVIRLQGYEKPILARKEFYQQFEQGVFDKMKKISDAADPYTGYQEWYWNNTPEWYEFVFFDLKTGESWTLEKGKMVKLYDDQGQVQGAKPPYSVLGWYDGDLILDTYEEAWNEEEGVTDIVKNNVYRWNIKTNKKEKLLTVEDGYVFDAGGLDNSSVVEGDKLLYLVRKPKLKADYFCFDLKTGEAQFMYEDKRNVPYRIIGETSDSFIYYTYDGSKTKMYKIAKDDYFHGNFDKSERLKGLDYQI